MADQHATTTDAAPRAGALAAGRRGAAPALPAPRPLRVLLLNERCHRNPLAGGAETHLFEIFGRLAARGVRTELLCCGFPGAAARDEHRGVAISRVGTRLSFYARVTSEARRRLAAGEVDLIVEAHNKVPFLSPLWSGGTPVLVIHHHLHGWTAFRQVAPPIAAASVALEALIPRVYRRVPMLTISASSKSDLVRRGVPEAHIDVVPCGLQPQQPGDLLEREPLVVSLGRLEPYKRIDLLLRAFPVVLEAIPAARLVVIGRGQQEARLRKLARRLQIAESVHFTGFASEEKKLAWLKRAALLVQCSTREGFGLTVVEAYSCGTPVVATDVPGLRDTVQDGVTGLLVRQARPGALAAAITKLLADEELRRRMSRRALAWSANFDWEESASAVLRAIRRAVGGSSSRSVVRVTSLPAVAAGPGGSP
ncbi:MAG TPA: glycosyltransferase family 4 protein [Planctomycetota bacterium]|nr:glycosyltransferase family 4 protein [Planctomycetota bacterium]